MTAKNLYENDNYYIKKGTIRLENGEEAEGYLCINRATSVVETEDTILPQIISFANAASDHLDTLLPTGTVDASIKSH